MDPISFLLGIAGTVLGNVVTELVTGRSKRASRDEIERQITAALAAQRAENANLSAELARTRMEFNILVARHPHLALDNGDVLLSGLKKPGWIAAKSRRNAILIQELRQLDLLIAERRQELAPSSQITESISEQPARDAANATAPPADSQQSARSDPPTEWARAIAGMENEIRKRREGHD